jgi:CheY-like chemotaxis protein
VGTTFPFTAWFRLAGAAELAGSPGDAAPDRPQGGAKISDIPVLATPSLRILLAEDNIINRELATGILTRRGHSLVHAVNGREAVDVACAGTFDLIFMDVQMPEMDGFEATRRIRALEQADGGHPTPIVAMTAHAMTGDRERCLAAGMDDYISKPLDKIALFALLARVAASRPAPAAHRAIASGLPEAAPASLLPIIL